MDHMEAQAAAVAEGLHPQAAGVLAAVVVEMQLLQVVMVALAAAAVEPVAGQEDAVAMVAEVEEEAHLDQAAQAQSFFFTHQDTNHDNLRTHHRQRSSRSN